jgi:hypothetical protein
MKAPRNADDMRKIIESPEGKSILAEIRSNSEKLNACPRHHYDPPAELKLGMKLTCTVCGGTLGLTDIGQYIKGYMAHGGESSDIWPGWGK